MVRKFQQVERRGKKSQPRQPIDAAASPAPVVLSGPGRGTVTLTALAGVAERRNRLVYSGR